MFQSAPGREAGRYPPLPATTHPPTSFNPRPAVRPGDTLARTADALPRRCFNPRPAVRPGDTKEVPVYVPAESVSIRARP